VRFLTGAGRYVDDISPDGALHAFVMRSSVAHGVITELDVADARAMPGVAAVITCRDLLDAGMKVDISGGAIKNRDGTKGAKPLRPVLALDRVRHVGEAVAMVIADTYANAKDAAEAILLEVDDLPAHVALGTGGEALHGEAPNNQAFDWGLGDEDAVHAAIGICPLMGRVSGG